MKNRKNENSKIVKNIKIYTFKIPNSNEPCV